MGNNNDGLKTFTDLAAVLHGMRASEPTSNLPKPKGPKQTRQEPTDVRWQPLVEMNNPLPDRLQVHLKLGKHPKTGAVQWFGFYEHGRDRLKVVCDPHYRHELPADGEIWEVRVTKQIPGIVFANADESVARKKMLQADEYEVLVETLERDDKRRSYHTPHYLVTARSVADSQIRVEMRIPLDAVPPRPGETWRVRKNNRSSYLPLSVEPVELIGEMVRWSTNEFSIVLAWAFEDPRHPDDSPNSYGPEFITGEYEGWQVVVVNTDEISFIHKEVWFVEVVKASLETKVLEVKALRPVIDVEGTEAMLMAKLVAGNRLHVHSESDGYEDESLFSVDGVITDVTWTRSADGYDINLALRRGVDDRTPVRIWSVRKFTDLNEDLKGFVLVRDTYRLGRDQDVAVSLYATKPRF